MDAWLKIFLGGSMLGVLLGFALECGFLRLIYNDRAKD
nr:MAG TPA: hypothetical protein [Caudoviricetes sp.]